MQTRNRKIALIAAACLSATMLMASASAATPTQGSLQIVEVAKKKKPPKRATPTPKRKPTPTPKATKYRPTPTPKATKCPPTHPPKRTAKPTPTPKATKPPKTTATPASTPTVNKVVALSPGKTENLIVGDRFWITLEGNPGTGFQWSYSTSGGGGVKLIATKSAGTNTTGGPETTTWTFEATKTGTVKLEYAYARSWEKKAPEKTSSYEVVIK